MNNIISMKDVSKSYDGTHYVLQHLDLEIKQGEFVVFIGKSGCGKTTLLKMINGLIPFEEGELEVFQTSIKQQKLIPLRQKIGYVIQQSGLFPHLNVAQNITYVLKLKKEPFDRTQKVNEMLRLVGLDESYANKRIQQLSGGQKQRVGVARALAFDPELILMDEPFGAVDEITRRNLQNEMKAIHQKLNKTIVFVTHDIEEALKLGTRIVLFESGKIVFDGNKFDLLDQMNEPYINEFFGMKNFSSFLSVTSLQEVKLTKGTLTTVKIEATCSLLEALKVMMEEECIECSVMDQGIHLGNIRFYDVMKHQAHS